MSEILPQPATHVDKNSTPTAALLFGVFSAPLAWAVQLASNFALAATACFDHGVALHLVRQARWNSRAPMLAVNLVAIAVAAAAMIVSHRAFRRANLRSAGMSSARSLGAAGLMSCAVFVIAMLFSLFVAVASPQCGG
jgi:hypothetical protein